MQTEQKKRRDILVSLRTGAYTLSFIMGMGLSAVASFVHMSPAGGLGHIHRTLPAYVNSLDVNNTHAKHSKTADIGSMASYTFGSMEIQPNGGKRRLLLAEVEAAEGISHFWDTLDDSSGIRRGSAEVLRGFEPSNAVGGGQIYNMKWGSTGVVKLAGRVLFSVKESRLAGVKGDAESAQVKVKGNAPQSAAVRAAAKVHQPGRIEGIYAAKKQGFGSGLNPTQASSTDDAVPAEGTQHDVQSQKVRCVFVFADLSGESFCSTRCFEMSAKGHSRFSCVSKTCEAAFCLLCA